MRQPITYRTVIWIYHWGFCVWFGVSGGIKSSLVFGDIQANCIQSTLETNFIKKKCFFEIKKKTSIPMHSFFKNTCVDQSPIGRSPRSTPASYCDIMDHIRVLLHSSKLSRHRGYTKGLFFQQCRWKVWICEGRGSTLIEMHFYLMSVGMWILLGC